MPSILFVGDVVGSPGRRALASLLPGLREELDVDVCVVNGENAAGGIGITAATARDLFDAGADAVTLGNHAYRHKEVFRYLDEEPRIVRPANFRRSNPGRGSCVVEGRGGFRLGVLNLQGMAFLQAARPPFDEADSALGALEDRCDAVLVDVHAEATSEKVGLGWYLDGQATAVVGTHTHVPTNDARVLPQGTAYITDVGMTGARGGVIGAERTNAIEAMRSQMAHRYQVAEEDPWLMAVLVRCELRKGKPARATSIEPVLRAAP